ncbi:MAG: MobQ family relaxase [Steroidobacteraceae bacterium]
MKETDLASFHMSVKCVSRASGRSAPAAAAYRAATRLRDERTGEWHDYARKRGVVHDEIVLPPGAPAWAKEREALWNAAEAAERRSNATVAREFEVALPRELAASERLALARELAQAIAARHRCAVDLALHRPSKDGDQRNHHAHLLCTTRRVGKEGLTEKTRELDEKKSGEVAYWRERWAALQNEALKHKGASERVDHRSFKAQGRTDEPGFHRGPTITAIERRGGWSYVLEREREAANERLARAAAQGRAERERTPTPILDLSGNVAAATRSADEERAAARAAWQALRSQSERPVPPTAPSDIKTPDKSNTRGPER